MTGKTTGSGEDVLLLLSYLAFAALNRAHRARAAAAIFAREAALTLRRFLKGLTVEAVTPCRITKSSSRSSFSIRSLMASARFN